MQKSLSNAALKKILEKYSARFPFITRARCSKLLGKEFKLN